MGLTLELGVAKEARKFWGGLGRISGVHFNGPQL